MKRISKTICLMLAAAFAALNMAGCISYVAIDEYGYVMTVGVDKGRWRVNRRAKAMRRTLCSARKETIFTML